MVVDFSIAIGPGVRVPGLFGNRVIYPVWLVGLQGLLFGLAVLVAMAVRRAKWELIYWTGRNPLGWFGYPWHLSDHTETEYTETEYTIAGLRAIHDREAAWIRDRKRESLQLAVINPVAWQLTFLGIPTLVALTITGTATIGPLLVGGAIARAVTEAHGSDVDPLTRFVRGLLELGLWLLGLWWVGLLLGMLEGATLGVSWYAPVLWDRLRTSVTIGGEYWVTGIDDGPPWAPELTTAQTLDGIDLLVQGLDEGDSARVVVASNADGRTLAYPADAPASHLPTVDRYPLENGRDRGP